MGAFMLASGGWELVLVAVGELSRAITISPAHNRYSVAAERADHETRVAITCVSSHALFPSSGYA